MFWVLGVITTLYLLILYKFITPTIETPAVGTPVVGTPVYEAADQQVDIAIAVSNQMIKALQRAGYVKQPRADASITILMQSSSASEISTEIVKSIKDDRYQGSVWVVVQDKQRNTLHLGRADNLEWCARQEGPETKSKVVVSSLHP